MADQDQAPQGAIPPKVTPFAKPEGGVPVTPAVQGAPRPITVRVRPASAPVPTGSIAAPAVGLPTAPAANPRSTSRVPVPESVAAMPIVSAAPATVRLRPVMPGAGNVSRAAVFTAPGSTQPIAPVQAPVSKERVTVFTAPGSTQAIAAMPAYPAPAAPAASAVPLQPQSPPTPGSHPLPDGPKPPSVAQVQASKSKTSRISLDSAIGVAPMTPMGSEKVEAKTIRLKRPTDLAAPSTAPKVTSTSPIRQTSRIPDAALPTASESLPADTTGVTQKKTLKIKRPGAPAEGTAVTVDGTGGEAFPEGVQMTAISSLEMPAKQESSVFTAVAVFMAAAAAVVLVLLTLCLGAHAMGPNKGPNALASFPGPELPWPGRISN